MKENKDSKKKAKVIELPPTYWGLNPEKIRKKAKRELKALIDEQRVQIELIKRMTDLKVPLTKITDVLLKRSIAYFAKCKDPTLSQLLFKNYYENAGLKFKKDDLNEIRGNMLRAGRKLYDLHNKSGISQEN